MVDDKGQIEWTVPPRMKQIDNIKSHGREQVNTCPILDNTAQHILKILSPWFVNTPKGTSLIFCKPFYHYSNDFDVCPGVLDSDMNTVPTSAVHAFIRFNVRNKVIHIKAGQPLIQLIPFKRMNWKLKYVGMNKKFIDTGNLDSGLTDKNSMTRFRHDESNKKFK